MRIITLIPSATEMVCDLGLGEYIVGVSHCCDTPEYVKRLSKVTKSIIPKDATPKEIDDKVTSSVKNGEALYQINGNLLKELQPDLIITQGICDVCAVSSKTVAHAVLPIKSVLPYDFEIVSLSGTTFEGVLKDLQSIAISTGKKLEADILIKSLRDKWDTLNLEPKHNKKMLVLEWPEPFFYGGHWVPEMIEVVGGISSLGYSGVDSGRCTAEDIIEENPDCIVFGACGYGLDINIGYAKEFIGDSKFSDLKAIKENKVWAIDANSYCSRPTTRIVEGAQKLKSIFEGKEVEGTHLVF